jgi:phospholipase C
MDKIVGYEHREHVTTVRFEPGEERHFRLPPVTPGDVMVVAPDQLPTEPRPRPPSRERDPATPPSSPPAPRTDLEIELTHPGSVSSIGSVSVTADSLWTDDLWRVRVKDKRPAGSPARDVPLVAKYNSVLPILERRVPAEFFHAGFASNYNDQQYLEVSLNDHYVEIGFRSDFADLYGLDKTGEPKHLFKSLFSEYVRFPKDVRMTGPVIDIGAGPHPNGSGNAVFFSVRADFPAMTVVVEPPYIPNVSVDLPAFSIRLRLWLTVWDGKLFYVPLIESELLDLLDFDVTYPDSPLSTKTINVKTDLKEAIERGIFNLQFPYENPRDYPSSFGKLLGRWLAGREAPIRGLGYAPGPRDTLAADGITEPASGEILVQYVGPREKPAHVDAPSATLGTIGPGAGDSSVPLFDPPFRDEEPQWDPADLGGLPLDPRVVHQRDLGLLGNIDHIVVLMQENRSFDHVLGYLSKSKLNPEVDGLLPDDHPDVATQHNHYKDEHGGEGNFVPTRAGGTGWDHKIPGPCHELDCVAAQVADNMGGFVADFASRLGGKHSPVDANDTRLQLVMEYHTGQQLPVYELLRQEFVICDAWYTSHPGPTWPNRFIFLTGDLNRDEADRVEEESPDPTQMPPIKTKLIFDYLNDWGVSWRVFEHGYSFPRLFRDYTYDITNIVPFDDPDHGFEATARSGQLPAVTVIEPDYIELPPGNDDHAPADMACGQDLVNRIFQALIASPGWEKTLFIITYDEHGGFYDHKLPPTNAVPPLANNKDALGPRVPGFVISPLAERGKVTHELFDHTSIGATILRRFAPLRGQVPFVSKRLNGARDFGFLLTQPARPSSDFTSLALPELLDVRYKNDPALNPCLRKPSPDTMALATDNKLEDFHWLLAAVRLATGEPPKAAPRRPPRDDRGPHPDVRVVLGPP